MNENKFDGKAEVYEKYRPNYPKELFDCLEGEIIGKNKVVADIGSGTGIFTRSLARFSGKVYAVEPSADMRASAEKTFADFPNIASVCGTSDDTRIPTESVDFVTVAQAFHWFDRKKFAVECARILSQNNAEFNVALVWNVRGNSRVMEEVYRVNKAFCPEFKGFSAGEVPEDTADFFRKNYICKTIANPTFINSEVFIGRCLSSSYAPKKGDENYGAYVDALSEAFYRHEKNGLVEFPYETRCFAGKI